MHQPRSDIWQAIDNLLLLSGAGTMVVGAIFLPHRLELGIDSWVTQYGGKREDAERYFDDIGYPVPPLMNPAE